MELAFSPTSLVRRISRKLAARAPLILIALSTPVAASEADWHYAMGIHDIAVRDVDSHTYGIAVEMIFDKRTNTGKHVFGKLDLFWDHDKDHLDPDHVPIWWQLDLGSDGELWRSASGLHLDWAFDANTRANTVSSVERQMSVLPALAAKIEGDTWQAALRGGVGYWFLELDDDAPRERGYDRDGLRRTTLAESIGADATVQLGQSSKIVSQAQGWWDDGGWLYSRYAGELHLSTDRWRQNSEIVLDVELNRYNIHPYAEPNLVPVLQWNDDLLLKLSFVTVW